MSMRIAAFATLVVGLCLAFAPVVLATGNGGQCYGAWEEVFVPLLGGWIQVGQKTWNCVGDCQPGDTCKPGNFGGHLICGCEDPNHVMYFDVYFIGDDPPTFCTKCDSEGRVTPEGFVWTGDCVGECPGCQPGCEAAYIIDPLDPDRRIGKCDC